MAKIHVSLEFGPGKCTAQEGNCPVTSATGGKHYDTIEEAQSVHEKMLEEEYSAMASFSKQKTKAPKEKLFHVDPNRDVGRLCIAKSESLCSFKEYGHYKTLEEANAALQRLRSQIQKKGGEQKPSELSQRKGDLFHIIIQGDRKGVALCKSKDEQFCRRKEYGHYKTLDEAKQALNKMFKQEKKKEPSSALPTRTVTAERQNNSNISKKRKTGLMERLTGRSKQGSEI